MARQVMRCKLSEVDVMQPLVALEVAAGERGGGVLVRRKGRPIGFLMQENAGKQTLPPEELSIWIANELKTKIAEEAIRDELTWSRPNTLFPSLSVAICTKDRATTVKRCLDSLLPLQNIYGFELLVVDNSPSDQATAGLVKELPTVRYALEKYPGLNFARNRAWREAKGELIAYLDDDVVVDRGWVAGLQEAFAETPDAGAFTGLVMPLKLDTRAQVLFEKRNGFRRGFDKKRFGRTLPGNSLYPCGSGLVGVACNMAFCRVVLRELGGVYRGLGTGASRFGGGDLDAFSRIHR